MNRILVKLILLAICCGFIFSFLSFRLFQEVTNLNVNVEGDLCRGASLEIPPVQQGVIVAGEPFRKVFEYKYQPCAGFSTDIPKINELFSAKEFYFNAAIYGSASLLIILGVRKYAHTRH